MSTDMPQHRAKPIDLRDVRCDIKTARPLFGASEAPYWSELPLGFTEVNADVTLALVDVEDFDREEELVIATATAYTVDLRNVALNSRTYRNIVDGFDHIGGEAFHVIEHAMAGRTIFSGIETDEFAPDITQLIVFEQLFVEEPYRGQRIGPRLLSTLVDAMGGTGESSFALLRAWPSNWPDLSDHEVRRAEKKITPSFEAVGFSRWRKGILFRHTAFGGPESLLP